MLDMIGMGHQQERVNQLAWSIAANLGRLAGVAHPTFESGDNLIGNRLAVLLEVELSQAS